MLLDSITTIITTTTTTTTTTRFNVRVREPGLGLEFILHILIGI